MNALANFVNMGGRITRQVGNYSFGIDGNGDRIEVLAFNVSEGGVLETSKLISEEEQAKIKTVDDLYDFIFSRPSAPDFTKVMGGKA